MKRSGNIPRPRLSWKANVKESPRNSINSTQSLHPMFVSPDFVIAHLVQGEMIKQYKGAKKIILFSQYPQHSCCTSSSSFCDAYRWLDKQNNSDYQDKISVIDQWWDRADYTELWAMLIQRKFEEMKKEHGLNDEDIRIIYSAHSLPESYCLEKGEINITRRSRAL